MLPSILSMTKNCDPTSQGKHGFTPLHCASQRGHINIIHYLINKLGCDPKIPEQHWQSSIAHCLF